VRHPTLGVELQCTSLVLLAGPRTPVDTPAHLEDHRPMHRALIVGIAALSLFVVACDKSSDVRHKLEADGYTDVEVTRAEGDDKYDIKAKNKEGAACTGIVTFKGSSDNFTMSTAVACDG
jgi:hypothetical protein